MASQAALDLVIGVRDNASGPLSKITSGLGGLAKIGGAAVLGSAVAGVGALGAALVAGIGSAREAAGIFAQSEAVIKSTGGAAGVTAQQVADFSSSLSAAAGKSLFGDDQIAQSENLLLTFTNLKGGVLEAATAMSVDMAQALGGAPADAAVQLGKALNDPIGGISALSRVGVTFTDQQKEQIKAMAEAGDVAGAQGVILAELNKEFGGSAAAAAAADGGFAQFKDSMGELAESVGAQVLPMLNSLMSWLNSPEVQAGITAVVGGLVTGFTNLIPILGGVTGPIADVIDWVIRLFNPEYDAGAYANSWSAAFNEILIPAFNAVSGVIQGTIIPAFQTVATFISEHISLLTTIATVVGTVVAVFTTISTIVSVISGVTAAIGGMSAAITGAGGVVAAIVAVLGGPLTIAIGVVALAAGALALAWKTNFGGIQEKTAAVVNWWTDTAQPAIAAAFSRVIETVTGMKAAWDRDFASVRGFITTLQTAWNTAVAAIGVAIDLAKGYITGFRDTVSEKVDEVVTFFTGLPGKITGALSGLAGDLLQMGKDAIQGIINGFKSIDIGSVLGGILRSGIAAAKAALGIRSPSRMTRDEIGRPLGEGIVEGILATAGMIRTALGSTVAGAIGGVSLDTSGLTRQSGGDQGDLGALIAQGSGRLGGAAPEIAGSQGALTALSFTERYTQSLSDLAPMAVVNITDWFQTIRREGSGPALVALQDQMYLGGLAGTNSLGNGLAHDLSSIRDAGKAAGDAYMEGFNSAIGGGVSGTSLLSTSRSVGLT